MSFAPTTPPVGQIPQPTANQNMDEYHIHSVKIVLTPGDQNKTRLEIKWSKGYDDAGTYKPIEHRITELKEEDADLNTKLAAATTGASFFSDIKTAMWDLLSTKGEIGGGTVT